MLMDKLRWTESRTLQSFLTSEFSRVGPGTAKEICQHAAVLPNTRPSEVSRDMAEKLLQGIQKTKIIAPPTDCLSPIGEELLEKGLRKEIRAEFYCTTSRPPAVYRGNPFVIEVGACPFTSESKEAIAHYSEIIKEIKLALQECGRLLGSYVRKKSKISDQIERANMFEKYIPEIADSLSVLSGEKKEKILQGLQKMLVKPEIKQEILQDDEDDKLYRMEFNKKETIDEEAKEE